MAKTSLPKRAAPFRQERFLSHLSAMEDAIDKGEITWSNGQAAAVCRRLLTLTIRIMGITAPPEGHGD